MKKLFRVSANDHVFGKYIAGDEQGARDACARDAGYSDEHEMVSRLERDSELLAEEVEFLAGNDFHDSEVAVRSEKIIEIYEPKDGGPLVVAIEQAEIGRLSRGLCGINSCICTGPHSLYDSDGDTYALTTVVVSR